MSKIAGTPECKRVRSQIVARESRSAFATFTAQDSAAYSAFIHGVELWLAGNYHGAQPALDIMRASMIAMQSKLRYLCKETLITILGVDGAHGGMSVWQQLQIGSDGWPIPIETRRVSPELPPLHSLPPRDGGMTRRSMPQLAAEAPLYCECCHTLSIIDGLLKCRGCGKSYGPVPK